MIKVRIPTLHGSEGYKTIGSAGCDVVCQETITIPGSICGVKVPTGVFIDSYEAKNDVIPYLFLMLRSSVAATTPLRLSNGIGLIDASYPDQICMLIDNLSSEPVTIERGKAIGQLVLGYTMPIQGAPVRNVERTGGFGSTDKEVHPADSAGNQGSS